MLFVETEHFLRAENLFSEY